MKKTAVLAVFLLLSLPLDARPRPRKSPHVEIVGIGVVETPPQRKRHANGRDFEELDVRLEVVRRQPGRGDDPDLPVDTGRRVHVVHDLSCGGVWVDAARGQRVELKGEYVSTGNPRGDVLHFTHPATGACGRAGGHTDGYIRTLR